MFMICLCFIYALIISCEVCLILFVDWRDERLSYDLTIHIHHEQLYFYLFYAIKRN